MMTRIQKIVLSIPSVASLLYFVTYLFPTKFNWLVPSMTDYYIHVAILQGLTIIQLIILLKRLWSYKSLVRSKKYEWTWILILFSTVSSLLYIWKRDEDFHQQNLEQQSEVKD